jgi:hypothetical protein
MSQQQVLTAEQQKLNLWEEHGRTGFSALKPSPRWLRTRFVNQVPVLIGANGRREVYGFGSGT